MDIHELIEFYQDGASLAELGRIYNKDAQTIKRTLIANNVIIRTRAEQTRLTNMRRKKSVDDTYFSNIDTVNKAWMMGFIAADGTIRKNENAIKIGLSTVDREILEKIKAEIKIERPIYDSVTQNGFAISELCWSSYQQKQDLSKYGIVNNKTYLPIYLPNFNNHELTLAFILGYFDGDGSFSVSKDGKYVRFRLCAHRNELLKDIGEYLKRIYGATYSLSKDNRGLYELSISTTFALSILHDMYALNSLRLDRKYRKYLEYINQETTTPNVDEKVC